MAAIDGVDCLWVGHFDLSAPGGFPGQFEHKDFLDAIDAVVRVGPGGGGGPAVDKISAINPEARIILSSGYSLNGMIKEVLDRGGIRGFIQKPFLINELSEKIREILGRKK